MNSCTCNGHLTEMTKKMESFPAASESLPSQSKLGSSATFYSLVQKQVGTCEIPSAQVATLTLGLSTQLDTRPLEATCVSYIAMDSPELEVEHRGSDDEGDVVELETDSFIGTHPNDQGRLPNDGIQDLQGERQELLRRLAEIDNVQMPQQTRAQASRVQAQAQRGQ